jgi:GNAT superfamily N-acetyltransferase
MLSGSDKNLARRIESGHAQSGLAAGPEAAREYIGGGVAIFQAVDLPSTQALAVGMNGPVTSEDLDHLEAFFHSRGSAAIIDVCTLADQSLILLIQQRGYVVREITNVLARRIEPGEAWPPPPAEIEIREVEPEGMRDWARIVVRGFMEAEEAPEDQLQMMSRTAAGLHASLAMLRGAPSGGAAVVVAEGLATLVGDSTLLGARGRGIQRALIHHRLRQAAAMGCDLASASVWPGSVSHRNYEKAGFQLLYARIMVAR